MAEWALPVHGQFFLEIEELSAADDLLRRPLGLAVSPDDENVYVVGNRTFTLLGYGRDSSTGELELQSFQVFGAEGVTGLKEPVDVIVSGDGEFVYTAAHREAPVGVFDRDPETGLLRFLESVSRSQVPGQGRAFGLALSPDGRTLYLDTADSIAAFSRDHSSGLLTLVDAEIDGEGGIDGLTGGTGVVVSPDGEHVYASGRITDSLFVFDRDPETGVLAFVERKTDLIGGVFGLQTPLKVALNPSGERLFAVSNKAVVFSRDPTTGALSFVQRLHASLTPGLPDFSTRDGAVSPDGEHYYLLGGRLAVFDIDPSPVSLSVAQLLLNAGGESLAVTADGKHVYVASNDDTLIHLDRDGMSGELSVVSEEAAPVFGMESLLDISALALSADGKNVYATAGCCDRGLLVFSRSGSGRLTLLEERSGSSCSGSRTGNTDGVTMIALSPEQAHVYWASPCGVMVFGRDPTDGSLTFQQTATGGNLDETRGLVVSPDGQHLYAGHYFHQNGTVVTFSRGAGGNLGFASEITSSTAPFDLAISPDGQHLYVSGESSVSVFARDASTGELALLEIQRDGVAGVTALDGARGLAMSDDGRSLYVAASEDRALVVFSRDTTQGFLTLLEEHRDGSMGVNGLESAVDVVLSETLQEIYVSGSSDAPLAVFARDPSDGSLRLLGLEEGGSLVGAPRGLAASPDGLFVYLAVPRGAHLPGHSSVSVMARGGIFTDGFESGDISAWSPTTS